MTKNIRYFLFVLITLFTISFVKAYTTTEEIDTLEIGVYIPNETKLYSSSIYSDNEGEIINSIIINYLPYDGDTINNQRNKKGDLTNPHSDIITPADGAFIKKYENIFGTDFKFDGWLVTQYFYKNKSLNIYLEPVNEKDISIQKTNWYSFREIDLEDYKITNEIKPEPMNGSVVFHLENDANLSYEFKSKKNESLYFKAKSNLIGDGNIKDELEFYVDNEKQDLKVTNMYQIYKIDIKKGNHTLKIVYHRKSKGIKYLYLRDLGLIKDLNYHEESYNKKTKTSLLKEEIYNKSRTIYSVEHINVEKKKHTFLIIIIAVILIAIIAYITYRIRGRKHEKKK